MSGTRFFYPDVTVICGPPETLEEERDVAVNPTVLIEVLSQSTEAYDRGPKFLAYQALSTLQDYLLVSQGSAQVEHYQRHPEGSGCTPSMRVWMRASSFPLSGLACGCETSTAKTRSSSIWKRTLR